MFIPLIICAISVSCMKRAPETRIVHDTVCVQYADVVDSAFFDRLDRALSTAPYKKRRYLEATVLYEDSSLVTRLPEKGRIKNGNCLAFLGFSYYYTMDTANVAIPYKQYTYIFPYAQIKGLVRKSFRDTVYETHPIEEDDWQWPVKMIICFGDSADYPLDPTTHKFLRCFE